MSESREKDTYGNVLENSPDEYLAVVLRYADWVDTPYKKLAAQHKENPKAVREIYLCACDKVPIEILTVAQKKEPVEESFRLSRKRHMESLVLDGHAQMLEEIKNTTSTMQGEVKSISGAVKDIADTMPYLEELFMNDRPPDVSGKDVEAILKKSDADDGEILTNGDTDSKKRNGMNSVQECFLKIKEKLSSNFFRRDVSPISYVQGMTEKGFSTEQIAFILDCIDEGMYRQELDNIVISPKVPIEMMEKLKKMQLEKRKEHKQNGI